MLTTTFSQSIPLILKELPPAAKPYTIAVLTGALLICIGVKLGAEIARA